MDDDDEPSGSRDEKTSLTLRDATATCWDMSAGDKDRFFSERFMLQLGWFVEFLFGASGFVVLGPKVASHVLHRVVSSEGVKGPPVQGASPWQVTLYRRLCGVADPLVVLLGLVSYVSLVLRSEAVHRRREGLPSRYADVESAAAFELYTELMGAVILMILLVLRVLSADAHPDWAVPNAKIRYAALNVYNWIDICALLPTLLDLPNENKRYPDLTWICLARTLEMAQRFPNTRKGLNSVVIVMSRDGDLIKMLSLFGLVVWLSFGGLYYLTNRTDDMTKWRVAQYRQERTVENPEPHLVQWERFESIGSSLWYALLNLVKEHPSADWFVDKDSKVTVVLCCWLGVALFAIPSGILGTMLQLELENTYSNDSPDGLEIFEAGPPRPLYLEDHGFGIAARRSTGFGQAMPSEPEQPLLERCVLVADMAATAYLTLFSVFAYMYSTVDHKDNQDIPTENGQSQLLGASISVSDTDLAVFDGGASAYFLLEWLARLVKAATTPDFPSYVVSWYHLFDILAWLPGGVHAFLAFGGYWTALGSFGGSFLKAACLLRLFKGERYIKGFEEMIAIIVQRKEVIGAMGLLTFLMWLFFSFAFYYLEHHNPDPEVAYVYRSLSRAFWAELINLHGEWPWSDYTAHGRALGAFVAILATAIWMVPIMVFADGYQNRLCDFVEGQTWPKSWQLQHRPVEAFGTKAFDGLYHHLVPLEARSKASWTYTYMALISVTLTITSAVSTLVISGHEATPTEQIEAADPLVNCFNPAIYSLDVICSLFFVYEYALRLSILHWRYATSCIGVTDLIVTVGFICTVVPQYRQRLLVPSFVGDGTTWSQLFDDFMVTVRLCRLIMLDNFIPFMHAFRGIFWIARAPLIRAAYTLVTVWYFFGVLLYVIEHDRSWGVERGHDELEDHYTDALTSLPHALIHLTGDYPCTEYKFAAILVHFVFLFLGMACTGAFTGIFNAAFISILDSSRKLERQLAAEKRLQVLVDAIKVVQRNVRRRRAKARIGQPPMPLSRQLETRLFCHDIVHGNHFPGRCVLGLFGAALICNVATTIVSTNPQVQKDAVMDSVCDFIQLVTSIIFMFEYFLRLLAEVRPWKAVLKPMRLVDLFCGIVPFIIKKFVEKRTWEEEKLQNQSTLFAVLHYAEILRVIRVLDFRLFRSEAALTQKILAMALPSLVVPLLVWLNIWVITSSLFVWAENHYDEGPERQHMNSIPEAMYWTSIYLLGEWANDTFSPGAGSRICIFYCLCAVSFVRMPVAIILEATQSALIAEAERRRQVKDLLKK